MTPTSERREHSRITVNERLEFLSGKIRGHGRLTDLSLGGLALESPDPPLGRGTRARVSFMIGGQKVETEAVVTRDDPGGTVGMQFVQLAPHERFGLDEYLRYRRGEGGADKGAL